MGVSGQHHAPAALTSGKDPVPTVQEAEWASEPVWIGAENLAPTGILFCCVYFYLYFFVLTVLALHFVRYCTTHITQTSTLPAGFEPAIPSSDQVQSLALDLSATGIGGLDPRTFQLRKMFIWTLKRLLKNDSTLAWNCVTV